MDFHVSNTETLGLFFFKRRCQRSDRPSEGENFLRPKLINLLVQELDLQLSLDIDLIVRGRFRSIESCWRFWLIMMKGAAYAAWNDKARLSRMKG